MHEELIYKIRLMADNAKTASDLKPAVQPLAMLLIQVSHF